jgi:hypothetical protein
LNGKRRLYLFKDLFGCYNIIRYIRRIVISSSPLCIIVRLGILAIEIGSGQIVVHSLYIVHIIQESNQQPLINDNKDLNNKALGNSAELKYIS